MNAMIPGQRTISRSDSPPSTPRLRLGPLTGRTLLDGGWWPRSTDPIAELPGLALALADVTHGPVTRFVLGAAGWDARPLRLGVANRVVRLGWFTSQDPRLVIATYSDGSRRDLLVIAPDTDPARAEEALAMAADPANVVHAPDILAAVAPVPA